MSSQKLERWEQRTGTPSILAAVVFLAAYAWPILQPDLPGWASRACSVTTWTLWAAFGIDLLVRLALAEHRGAFLKKNWLDVVTSLLPMLRPLRPLRSVVALNVLRHHGRVFARGRVVTYVGTAVAAVGFVAAVAVLDAERRTEQEVSDLTAEVLALRQEIAAQRERSPQEVR